MQDNKLAQWVSIKTQK